MFFFQICLHSRSNIRKNHVGKFILAVTGIYGNEKYMKYLIYRPIRISTRQLATEIQLMIE